MISDFVSEKEKYHLDASYTEKKLTMCFVSINMQHARGQTRD